MKLLSNELRNIASMKNEETNPKNKLQFLKLFGDEDSCKRHLVKLRWNNEPTCPYCESKKIYCYKIVGAFRCKDCKKQFSALKGTLYENSKIPLSKWFYATYIVTSHKKGISSYQLSRDIGVTQKSAWYMLQRIREGMENVKSKERLEGVVELDETYVGGKNKNRHADKKVKNSQGRSHVDKTPVFGILKRESGEVRLFSVKDVTFKTLKPIIIKNVKAGSEVMTDEWTSYSRLHKIYKHKIVRHGKGEYVKDDCHTNGLENFWSHLKRSVIGIYHHVSRRHINKYLNEFAFRFNTRGLNDYDRFAILLGNCEGHLMYKDLMK